MVDDLVWVKTEKGQYELVEDAHVVVCHLLATSLVKDR
jgi:D-sedoheptulose 7-phosphate isomerase